MSRIKHTTFSVVVLFQWIRYHKMRKIHFQEFFPPQVDFCKNIIFNISTQIIFPLGLDKQFIAGYYQFLENQRSQLEKKKFVNVVFAFDFGIADS